MAFTFVNGLLMAALAVALLNLVLGVPVKRCLQIVGMLTLLWTTYLGLMVIS